MSKQAVDEILAAEAKAQKIRDDATRRARYMIEETQKTASSDYQKALDESAASMKERLAALNAKTDELLAKNETDSKKAAAKRYADSEERIKSCSRLIVGRVLTKWQL